MPRAGPYRGVSWEGRSGLQYSCLIKFPCDPMRGTSSDQYDCLRTCPIIHFQVHFPHTDLWGRAQRYELGPGPNLYTITCPKKSKRSRPCPFGGYTLGDEYWDTFEDFPDCPKRSHRLINMVLNQSNVLGAKAALPTDSAEESKYWARMGTWRM